MRGFTVGIVVLTLSAAVCRGQGDLTPPGPPAPTMKALDEVEPRTKIGELPFDIVVPGSYYLGGNLNGTQGIIIQADNVTLDLCGFSLLGGPGASDGILVSNAHNNILILNGVVQGWDRDGVAMRQAYNSRVEGVRSYQNGDDGIAVGDYCQVERCQSSGNGGDGVEAVRGCLIRGVTVHNNRFGIRALSEGHTIESCLAEGQTQNGIVCGPASTVRNCLVRNNGSDGLQVNGPSLVEGNACVGNGNPGGVGLCVIGTGNRVRANHLESNWTGLYVYGKTNWIDGNTVCNNAYRNYDFTSGNYLNLLLCELPEIISWPASVRLAGTLTGRTGTSGLMITASDVTVDLGGHALVGVPGSQHGIYADPACRNISVRNGVVRNWGGSGIDLEDNCLIENVQAQSNQLYGVTVGRNSVLARCTAHANGSHGLATGYQGLLRECTADDNGGFGMVGGQGTAVSDCAVHRNALGGITTASGKITGCAAWQNEGPGIIGSFGSVISDCSAFDNMGVGIKHEWGDGLIARCAAAGNDQGGIMVDVRSSVQDCQATLNTSNGITVTTGSCTIQRCMARDNTRHGIEVTYDNTVRDCDTVNNGSSGVGAGVRVTWNRNRIDGNTLEGNRYGLLVEGEDNIIVRNMARNSWTNYAVPAVNACAAVQDMWSNPSFLLDQPWANFEY